MAVDIEMIDAMMEETEEYFSDVTEIAEKNFKHAEFREFSRKVTADYKRDYDKADLFYGKCLAAHEALKDRDITKARVTKLQKAHDAFFTATQALDEGNGMFTAFLDEGVAEKAAGLLVLLTALIKGQQKQVGVLLDDIEDIEKLLKKAKKDVTGAKVQMAFNLTVTAICLCYPPLRGAQAVFVALGTTGARLMADEFLGPTGPSNAAAIKAATTDYVGVAEEVGKIGNTITTVYSTVDTMVSDGTELGKAEKTVAAVRKKLAATIKAHAALMRLVAGSDRDLLRLAVSLEKAVKAAHAAKGRFEEHEMTRYDLLAELEEA